MAATTTDTNLATVRQFMDAVVEGKLDDARRLLHDDFVVHEAGGLPYSGEYHGPDGFFELLTKMNEFLELNGKPLCGPLRRRVIIPQIFLGVVVVVGAAG
jgi:limonene-1,2-epoxide hydrolase